MNDDPRHPSPVGDKMGAQRGKVTCPKPHSSGSSSRICFWLANLVLFEMQVQT